MPAAGVAALQSNFYITDDLERVRKGNQCSIHSRKELEFFCVPCDQAICINCKLTDHELHQTQDLCEAVELKKKELTGERPRVQKALTELAQQVEAVREDRKDLQNQKAAVEAAIHVTHAMMIAAVDEARDKQLTSLQALNAQLERGLDADLAHLLKNLDEVRNLDQQLEEAVNNMTGCQLLALAKEMKDGRGSHKSINLLTSVQRRAAGHLEFKLSGNSDAILTQIRNFMGCVCKVESDATPFGGDAASVPVSGGKRP